jgi:peptidoglycan-N-acetylglucosamine deacetylase
MTFSCCLIFSIASSISNQPVAPHQNHSSVRLTCSFSGARMALDSAILRITGHIQMARGALFLLMILATNACLALLYPYSHARLLLVLAIYACGTSVTLYLLFHPRNQWLVANRSQVDGANCIALTFDDGPDPTDTPSLLDILQEKGVKATFFVIGKRAEQFPAIVQRARNEGHLIANHTWSHPNLFCFLTPRRLRAEIERGTESVQRSCGFRTRYFRSPVGLRHPLLRDYLQQMGLEFISWRIRSFDTVTRSSAVLTRRILSKVSGGEIILFHDHLPSGADAMLEALPGIIDTLRERGFEFVLAGSPDEARGVSLQAPATPYIPLSGSAQ